MKNIPAAIVHWPKKDCLNDRLWKLEILYESLMKVSISCALMVVDLPVCQRSVEQRKQEM